MQGLGLGVWDLRFGFRDRKTWGTGRVRDAVRV
jgi:hypothetical protein